MPWSSSRLVPFRFLPFAAICLLAFPFVAAADDDDRVRGQDGYRRAAEEQRRSDLDAGAPGAEAAAEIGSAISEKPQLLPARRQRDPLPATSSAASPTTATPAPSPDSPDSTPGSHNTFDPNAETAREGRRIQLFLIPLGTNSGMVAQSAQRALEKELARLPGFTPVDLVQELDVPPSPEEVAKVEAARRHARDGNVRMAAHDYIEAKHRYRKALETLLEAGIALQPADYVDISARLGTALILSGEEAAGRAALLDAVRNDPNGDLIPGDLPARGLRGLDEARAELSNSPSGALSFVTAPPGARIFTSGVYRGTTPLTLDHVPAGNVIVRLDRPGAYPWVQVVESRVGHDTPIRVRMSFTPEAIQLQRMLVEVPRELNRSRGMPEVVRSLGSRFRLNRAVIATAQMNAANNAGIRIAVFDFDRDAKLVDETAAFTLDNTETLEPAIAQWAQIVFDKADASRNRRAADPLDRIDGTENWHVGSSSRSDGRTGERDDDRNKRRSRGRDPLSNVDGTEDW